MCKAAVFSTAGHCLALAGREYPARPAPFELDSRVVWQLTQQVIAEVARSAQQDPITALCVSSLGEAMVPVSRNREILASSILCVDPRGAEYARALFQAWQVADTEEEIEQLVAARLDRQRIFGRDRPPSVWAVIDEAVLHRPVGGAKVMHDQLEHLAEMSCRPRASVQVIPAEVGAHAGLLGGVSIAGFADDAPGIVYLDTSDQGQTFKAPDVVARMFTIFDTLRSEALPRGASRDLIGKVASERWTP